MQHSTSFGMASQRRTRHRDEPQTYPILGQGFREWHRKSYRPLRKHEKGVSHMAYTFFLLEFTHPNEQVRQSGHRE